MKEALLACRDLDALKSELRCIVDAMLAGQIETEADLETRKKDASSRLRLATLPSNADILSQARPEEREALKMLVRKPTRTLSGVAVIAAMTSPARCPHGTCVPCPGGIQCTSPQSYTGREPAALRAEQHGYDPYAQVTARLSSAGRDRASSGQVGAHHHGRDDDLPASGLPALVCPALPPGHERLSRAKTRPSGGSPLPGSPRPMRRHRFATSEPHLRPGRTGAVPKRSQEMLSLGATKVELGVQSTRDDLLQNMLRGHTVQDAVTANRNLREAGLKVGFHMMPGLPGSTPKMDLEVFRELFSDSRFRPDYLKIYPTLVVEGTELYRQYQRGEYAPLGDAAAAELVSRIKEIASRLRPAAARAAGYPGAALLWRG